MPSKELYIGNVNPDTKPQEIREIFEVYGTVNRCEVKFGGTSKSEKQFFSMKLMMMMIFFFAFSFLAHSAAFGFVGFDSSEDAEVFSINLILAV